MQWPWAGAARGMGAVPIRAMKGCPDDGSSAKHQGSTSRFEQDLTGVWAIVSLR